MGLLNESFVEDFELELIGSEGRYAFVYLAQGLLVSDDARARDLSNRILQVFLRTPVATFPHSFMSIFQDLIVTCGWWLTFDEHAYKLPANREYFRIVKYPPYDQRSKDNVFRIYWGDEEICQITLPFDIFPDFELLTVDSKYYVAQ